MDATPITPSPHAPPVMQSALLGDSQAVRTDSTSELVASLKKLARHGTRVETAGSTMSAQIRIDIIVSSRSERIGVICDQVDSRKIHRQRSLLNDLFVDRVYLTSQLDVIMDPFAVAGGIARREPDLFSTAGEARDAFILRPRVGVVRGLRKASDHVPSRSKRPSDNERPGDAARPVRAA